MRSCTWATYISGTTVGTGTVITDTVITVGTAIVNIVGMARVTIDGEALGEVVMSHLSFLFSSHKQKALISQPLACLAVPLPTNTPRASL